MGASNNETAINRVPSPFAANGPVAIRGRRRGDAKQLWEESSIGDLAAEEFLSAVQAARNRFRYLLSLPAIGLDVDVSGAA